MDETTNVLTPPPPPGTPPPPGGPRRSRRLTRRIDQKVVAGVCAGLGEYFNVDPVLFRAAFIVLAVLGGTGVFLYGLAWLLLPAATGPSAPLGDPPAHRALHGVRGSSAWVGIALLIGGAALLLSDVANRGPFRWVFRPGLIWGAALILLGVFLYQRAGNRRADTGELPRVSADPSGPDVLPAAGSPEPAPAFQEPVASAPTYTPEPVPVGYPVARRARRRQRSILGWVTLGTLLLAVGVGAILDQSDAVYLTVGRYLALALTVLGLGLLVGTWWGRARWLIVLGILLIPAVLAASLIHVPLTGGTGERFYHPVSSAEIPPAYHLAAGRMVIDLRNATIPETATVEATVGFGELDVDVPYGATVVVHGSVGGGQITIDSFPFDPSNRSVDGVNIHLDQTFGPSNGTSTIVLNLSAGFGQISVFRSQPEQAG